MPYIGQLAVFSNREDWQFSPIDVYDDDSGEAIDLTGATISYGIYEDAGCSGRQVLAGKSGDGTVLLVESTVFQITIPRSSITGLCSGTYSMGITVENAGITASLFAGDIAVIEGNVPV